ncbi:Copper amine oxidase N-terminal domain-containing protein [Thermosyntropha lipolytica DSM 11003]|uniref:Copper amine oxidase N-terminal domain-containing protein n=1 Tax=Thermosyntropha lipolytica DSM 11003 TaxID=1123382 RepID=A0A1M5NLP4_9FIRM|nr:copper amine oxidase N-terminal domain-containing protein [Thermosyntropha lipolytica]SHG90432.1 Copper amine oxidase N-terminal domain-containing protein [Thermosyntropha lipolytica DSM 11003]
MNKKFTFKKTASVLAKGKIWRFCSYVLFIFIFSGLFMVNTAWADEGVVARNDKVVVFKIDNYNYYLVDIKNNKAEPVRMDTAPKIYPPGRTFVPVRFLGNALGVDDNNITWQANTQTAILKGNKTLKLQINNKTMHSNDKPVQMDVAPLIQHPGRTMLPARYVAEGLGYIVEWDAKSQMVIAYPEGQPKPDVNKIREIIEQKIKEQHEQLLQGDGYYNDELKRDARGFILYEEGQRYGHIALDKHIKIDPSGRIVADLPRAPKGTRWFLELIYFPKDGPKVGYPAVFKNKYGTNRFEGGHYEVQMVTPLNQLNEGYLHIGLIADNRSVTDGRVVLYLHTGQRYDRK